jgi:hypothetical protein
MGGNGGELSSFLEKLGEDSELRRAYLDSPKRTLEEAGLSEETKETLLSRDPERIHGALEKERPGVDLNLYMTVIAPGDEP